MIFPLIFLSSKNDNVTENDLNKIFDLKTKYLCINDEYKTNLTQKINRKSSCQ